MRPTRLPAGQTVTGDSTKSSGDGHLRDEVGRSGTRLPFGFGA
jgi:hypothetical protein